MFKNADEKAPTEKVGDNVCIHIPDVDIGHVAVVMHFKGTFYKLGTELGVLVFSNYWIPEVSFPFCPKNCCLYWHLWAQNKNHLRTVVSSQSLTGSQGYTRCNCTTTCSTNRQKCKITNICGIQNVIKVHLVIIQYIIRLSLQYTNTQNLVISLLFRFWPIAPCEFVNWLDKY